MTYHQILLWIQDNVVYIKMTLKEKYQIAYFDEEGCMKVVECNDLISGVLKINACELVK